MDDQININKSFNGMKNLQIIWKLYKFNEHGHEILQDGRPECLIFPSNKLLTLDHEDEKDKINN